MWARDPATPSTPLRRRLEALEAAAGQLAGGACRAAGDNGPSEAVAALFDGRPDTKWLDFGGGGPGGKSWVEYRLPQDMPVGGGQGGGRCDGGGAGSTRACLPLQLVHVACTICYIATSCCPSWLRKCPPLLTLRFLPCVATHRHQPASCALTLPNAHVSSLN